MDIHKIATEVMAAWNNKDLEKLAALYNEEVVFFDPLLAKEIRGKAIIDYAASIFAAFPDVHFVIKSEAVGKDVVMIEWVQCGTNSGSIIGRPATNRYLEVPAVSVIKFDQGRLLSHYDYWDLAKVMSDLGFV